MCPICGEKREASGWRQQAGALGRARWVRARPEFAQTLGQNAGLPPVTLWQTRRRTIINNVTKLQGRNVRPAWLYCVDLVLPPRQPDEVTIPGSSGHLTAVLAGRPQTKLAKPFARKIYVYGRGCYGCCRERYCGVRQGLWPPTILLSTA